MGIFFRKLLRLILILCLILIALLLIFRFRYQSTVKELANTQVKNATSDLINDAIMKQIANNNIRYDRMVYFEKDLDGRITALKTNMGEINKMKTDALSIINEQILDLDTSDIGIPIGSLLFPELFSGKGPVIPVRVLTIRNSDADFSSSFSEAGINQTIHQIRMVVSVDVAVLVLGKTEVFTVSSEMVVAETVIVGSVPNTILQFGGNNGTNKENTGAGGNTQ